MSFFSKVKSFFHQLFGALPSWEKSVSSTLTLLAPLTEEIVALTAGEPAAKEVQAVVGEVQKDMATVAAVTAGAAGSPSATTYETASTALNSIKSNLGGLLAAGHIKNPVTLTKVTETVNTVIMEVEAILSELPQSSSPPATAPSTQTTT